MLIAKKFAHVLMNYPLLHPLFLTKVSPQANNCHCRKTAGSFTEDRFGKSRKYCVNYIKQILLIVNNFHLDQLTMAKYLC